MRHLLVGVLIGLGLAGGAMVLGFLLFLAMGPSSGELVAAARYVAPSLFVVGSVTGWFMSARRQRQHDKRGRVMRHVRRLRDRDKSQLEG